MWQFAEAVRASAMPAGIRDTGDRRECEPVQRDAGNGDFFPPHHRMVGLLDDIRHATTQWFKAAGTWFSCWARRGTS